MNHEDCATFHLQGTLQESSSLLQKSFTGSLRSAIYNNDSNNSVAVKSYLYNKDKNDLIFILQHFVPFFCSLSHHPQLIPWLGYQLVPEKSLLKIITKMDSNDMINLDHFLYKKNLRIEDEKVILQIALDIASVLHHLHQNGIVYSCLRPGYIYLYENCTRAKLCLDLTHLIPTTPFTAASPSSQFSLHHLPTIAHLQIPTYQSPETFEAHHKDWTTKVDIYAFGILLNELFSKTIPWHSTPTDKVRVRVCEDKVRPIIPSHLSKEITNLISQCWEQESENRPTTEQLLVQLNQLLRFT